MTRDVSFREVTRSYQSQMSFDLHKIEASYSYLDSLGISGGCQLDTKSLHELSKSTIWDVHITISPSINQKYTVIPHKDKPSSVLSQDSTFSMYVEDVFDIPNFGPVITGCVASGVVRIGDVIYLIEVGKDVKTATVKGIEMFKKILDRAERGDNIGLLVDGIGVSDIMPGGLVTKDASVATKAVPKLSCNTNRQGLTDAEKEYLEEYQCVLADGEITPRERKSLDRCRMRLGLSSERAKEIEDTVVPTTDEEKEYLEEYRYQQEEGEIGERERRTLERLRNKLGLTKEQAEHLEMLG